LPTVSVVVRRPSKKQIGKELFAKVGDGMRG
jgi:hypothetical protein